MFGNILNELKGFNPSLIFLWFIICLFNHFLTPIYSSFLITSFNKFNQSQKDLWRNRSTSFFHSIIMSLLFIIYWLFPSNDINYSTKSNIGDYEHFCMNIMIGYLIYDTLFEFISAFYPKKIIKENKKAKIDGATIQILLHHLLGLISHFLIQFPNCGTGSQFLMGIYGAEMSTPFLNISWLLLELGFKDSKIFFINGLFLLATFIWRNILGTFILYQFYNLADSWNNSTNLDEYNINHKISDNIVYYLLLFITICFAGLNVLWTIKLMKKAFGK